MHSYRPSHAEEAHWQQQQQQQQPVPQVQLLESDDDDDHIPLSVMAGGAPALVAAASVAAAEEAYNRGAPYQPRHRRQQSNKHQHQQQQQQQQQAYGQCPSFAQHAPALSYQQQQHHQLETGLSYQQQQLEMELNQQQQQFQQQFLQQYHQVQQLGADQHDWVHDGFVSPHAAAGYQYALGFHSTSRNPNLPHHHIIDDAASSMAPSSVEASHHRRHHAAARPWVKGVGSRRQSAGTEASGVPDEASAPSSSASSASSSSSGVNSSDESAYNYGSTMSQTPVSRSASSLQHPQSQTTSRRPAPANGSEEEEKVGEEDVEEDDDDDDDVPLSIISSSSAQSSDVLAAVRRTKSAAPSALSPRPTAALQYSVTVARHTPKSRSIEISRSEKEKSATVRRSEKEEEESAVVRHSEKQEPAASSSDDEDAPLDVLQAELQAEFRPADALQSDATAASAHSRASDSPRFARGGARAASKPNKLLHLLKASTAQSSRPNSSASSAAGSPPSDDDDDAAFSRGSPPRPDHQPSHGNPPRPDYLPSRGTALPAVPVAKRKADKARAGVQYIALADIVENTERALLQQEELAASAGAAANDSHAARRNKSVRRGAGAGVGADSPASDARSLASQATEASSNGGALMDVLRAGPVELLTASSDHSGSKAVVERVVPEDYGDLDQLLADLDGIMSGSQAARRRFSLVLMRRSLALANGLVEPADFAEQLSASGEPDDRGALHHHHRPAIEFRPLELPQAAADAAEEGLGMDDILLSAAAASGGAEPPAPREPVPPTEPPAEPEPPAELLELTRGQKVQRALEKLELLNFRKVSVRIYVQDARRYYSFILTEYTTCELILNDMKKSGIIDPDKTTWALFELVHYFGIERPLNHFENIMNVVESWEPRSNNYIIVKAFAQQSSLTLLGGVQQGDHAIQGMLYFRQKKSKWQKGVFRLQGHNMVLVKDAGRGKQEAKEAHYLTLTSSDVYTPFEPLRGAPTRFVFGLKSEMPMQMFEKPDEDYVKWFAVPSLESLREWLLVLRLAKNQIKFCKVLERRAVETGAASDCEKPPAPPPLKPLVGNPADPRDAITDKKNSDFAAELVTSINKIASNSRHDPSALVKAMEQGGVDVSDFKALGAGANPTSADDPDDYAAALDMDNLFQPGSLLSKPKRTAAEIEAAKKPLDADMFVKGSLLSQPRESKAMAASRAIQSIMAQDGNVFTHGSLLQVCELPKPARPPHVGGAANLAHLQFPLVQPDHHPALDYPAIHELSIAGAAPTAAAANAPIFGGLLAAASAQPPQQQRGLNANNNNNSAINNNNSGYIHHPY